MNRDNRLISEEREIEKKSEKTRRYDAVSKKIYKLLTATAANYIPELAEALKDDWYPHLSVDIIKVHKGVQDEIRDKILDDYSHDRKSGAPWASETIMNFFPDWLRNPNTQVASVESIKLANAAKRYKANFEHQRGKFEEVVEHLPQPPREIRPVIQEDEEDETETTYRHVSEDELPKKHEPEPFELYEDGLDGISKAWKALTGIDHLPGQNEDVLLDYIKPTRKHRLRVFKGLDERTSNWYQWALVYMDKLIQDTLRMCKEEVNSNKSSIPN